MVTAGHAEPDRPDPVLYGLAVAVVLEDVDADVTTLARINAVLDATHALEAGGYRLLLVHPDEVVVGRREQDRRRWWRRRKESFDVESGAGL